MAIKNDHYLSPVSNLRRYCLFVFFFLFISSASAQAQSFEYYGELTQGGVVVGKAPIGSTIELNGTTVMLSDEGYFVFGFGRDAKLKQLVSLKQGQRSEEIILNLEKREYNIQRIEGVPQSTVTPPKDALSRIKSETQLVKQARRQHHDRTDFLQSFIAPSQGRITGVYGSQRVYNGVPKRPHYGIDYAGPVGDPVIAPAPGIVTLVHSDMYYSGGTLIVDHGFGLSSTFIHLSKILVAEGDTVDQGQIIAEVGQGGRSTGPHLDWRMNWRDQRVDPDLMLKMQLPDNF